MKSFRQIIMMTLNNDEEEITKYLTIIPLEENFQISFTGNYTPQYSYNGSDWYDWTSGSMVSINMGTKLYVKGNLPQGTKCGRFETTQRFNLSGNCNSMIFGDDTENEYAKILTYYNNVFESLFYNCPVVEISEGFLPAHTLSNYCYYKMFQNCTSLITTPLLPASTATSYCYANMFENCNLLVNVHDLPAETLSPYCYSNMFKGCTSLETAPALPAKTLNTHCYRYMFYGCTSLENAPDLPAEILSPYCYYYMFRSCTSLKNTPALQAKTLASYCYYSMFGDCTSLENVSDLPATTLENYCYGYMFYGCTSLKNTPALRAQIMKSNCYIGMFDTCTSLENAPALPATTLASHCYSNMFSKCTSLKNAPKLPAKSLITYCYQYMFNGCTSLEKAPELPATTLASGCYNRMFEGCTNLSYIKALFTHAPATSYMNSWVSNVSSTGTFIKSKNATWTNTFGTSAIPNGWDVLVDGFEDKYMTIEALEDGLTAKLSLNECEYSTNAINWETLEANTDTPSINAGEKLYFKGNITPVANKGVGTFTITKQCSLKGNCNSLLFGDDAATNMSLAGKSSAFENLFQNCSTIVSVSEDFLPATTLENSCYSDMFYGCTSLENTPVLPAPVMKSFCYNCMFFKCTSLSYAHDLPATTLASYCYRYMFYECTSLREAPALPATTLVSNCYQYMFEGCSRLSYIKALFTTAPATTYMDSWVLNVASTGTFVKSKNATWTNAFGVSAIPNGWDVVIDADA